MSGFARTALLFALFTPGNRSTIPAPQQRTIAAAVTQILDSARAANDLPALAGAIVTRDGVIALDVVGTRRYGGTVRVTKEDRFHLGSDTKAMTAGLAGLLVDRGQLKWTSTVAELFPDLAGVMQAEFKTVTVRELLSHQSGLIENASRLFFEPTPREQRASFVKWALQQPPVSARGVYHYANANYIVVGAAIERILNAPYEQAIVDQLLAPLGITTAGWGAPGATGTVGREDQPWPHSADAANHRTAIQPSETADNPPIYSPAGRVNMSMGDWAKWIQAVLRAEAGQSSPWSAATAHELTAPAVSINAADSYAFGWIAAKRDWAGPTGRTLTHAGSNTMNFAVAWLAPDVGFAVLVATNQGGDAADRATNGVAGRLIALYVTGR